MPASENNTRPPALYVFFGLIATGKSTLAMAWARHKQVEYYNSDRVRKELAGLQPTQSQRQTVDTGIYTPDFTRKTYQALLDKAEARLRRGDSVVLDASYQNAGDRQKVRELVNNLKSRVYFILCQCPEEEMRRRMGQRARDPSAVSDGRWEIYLQQKKRFEPPNELADSELITINTQAPVEKLLEKLDNELS